MPSFENYENVYLKEQKVEIEIARPVTSDNDKEEINVL